MPLVIAVIGGGISGLGAAHALALAGAGAPDVVVLEASDSFGGKIASGDFEGRPIEFGPDNFLTRDPSAADLCRSLGLGDDLIAPATSAASVVVHGRLRPLPAGLVLGIPTDLGALARSGILSSAGLLRASLDLTLPGRPMDPRKLGLTDTSTPSSPGGEWSATAILGRRLGHEVVERLIDPLLGGINAGSTDHLSLAVVAPQVARALDGHRSVIEALRPLAQPAPARRTPAQPAPAFDPLFLGLRGGLGRMVARLVDDLGSRGVSLRPGTPVRALARRGNRFELDTPAGTLTVDGVVLALPAYAAAPVVHPVSPSAAAELGSVPYASVAVVTCAFATRAVGSLPAGSGFLVPRREGRLVTGCTILSQKWPGMALDGEVLIRASTGRYGDERPAGLDDAALTDRVIADLADLIGVRGAPLSSRVQRWSRAFPQYLPGHLGRLERARTALAALPPIALAGAALGGIGIPACLTNGERAAAAVLDRLDG